MAAVGEGVKRLSLAVGVIGLVVYLIPAVVTVGALVSARSDYQVPDAEKERYFAHLSDSLRVRDFEPAAGYPSRSDWEEFSSLALRLDIETAKEKRYAVIVAHRLEIYQKWLAQAQRQGRGDATKTALLSILAVIVGAALSFAVPWGAVRGIAWVVAGFGKDSDPQ